VSVQTADIQGAALYLPEYSVELIIVVVFIIAHFSAASCTATVTIVTGNRKPQNNKLNVTVSMSMPF
jgi:hypothetical protein